MRLTVVVPTLNEEPALRRHLPVLLAQLEEGDEVVVSDGGSTDGTAETARSFGVRVITGAPGRPRDWYANLVANPAFTFHLKESATADLPATARPVTDPAEREKVFAGLLATLGSFTSRPGQHPEVWVASSPLVEVTLP